MHPDAEPKPIRPLPNLQPYVIKEHKLAELVNELEAIAKTYEGCQCRRSMFGEAVRKHLKTT